VTTSTLASAIGDIDFSGAQTLRGLFSQLDARGVRLVVAEMTEWFLAHTIKDGGFRRTVEPKIVLEVAFNNMMRSSRHESGYALRFPRIVRIRTDKLPEEIDTLDTVREIFSRQNLGRKAARLES
jgi:hypothetical protein